MSTTHNTPHDCHQSYRNNNLETFSLFWLDASVTTSPDNIATLPKLRSIINQLQTFDDAHKCENHIQSLPEEYRLVLIVSGGLGRQIVPRIHHLRQLASVYVYCMDKERNKQWANQFNKVKLVTTNLNELIAQINSDRQRRVGRDDEPLPHAISDRSTGEIKGNFLDSQLLIAVLIRMQFSTMDMDEFVSLIEPKYKGNQKELDILKEFKRDYQAERAVWWYSRDSFIYQVLNQALRVQNTDILFVFRFLIRDLKIQLERHQCTSPVHVYRGQLMSNDEVKILKNSIGHLISMNSFLSTSLDRKVTLNFLKPSGDLQRVLFEIYAHPNLVTRKPFANIRELSYFKKEEEVLFMLGSIFRINGVRHGEDGVWFISLTLCSDDDHDLKFLLEYMQKELCSREINLISFGNVLRLMGKFDDAEKIYHRYLKELHPDHRNVANCYHSLGNVALDKADYASSLEWFRKALGLYERLQNHTAIADTFSSIGLVYYNKDDYERAIESYTRALKIYRHELGDDHRKLAICFDGMGAVYSKEKKYADALKFKKKALAIWTKHRPADHPDLGQSHTCIGTTYSALGQYDLAMRHYNHSLEIYDKSLPADHPRRAMTFKNMGVVYENTGDLHRALIYYQKAAAIYRHAFSPNHADVVDIEERIKRVSH